MGFFLESDGYSGGTDSKTIASSKTTMELYDTTTNGTKPSTISLNHMGLNGKHHHVNETSISGGEDELISNKSDDRFSGQTDFEMVKKKWFCYLNLILIINFFEF